MRAKIILTLAALICILSSVHAGDVSTFVNLGFSSDSKYFMFGLHAVRETNSFPYAEAYIVDIQGNRFVPSGQFALEGKQSVSLGQDGSAALFKILGNSLSQIQQYKIDHLLAGRPVYVLFNGQEPKEKISFRDFNTGNAFSLSMIQSARQMRNTTPSSTTSGNGSAAVAPVTPDNEAEFSLQVEVTAKDGSKKNFTVGRPSYFRPHVDSYRIRQVVLSPDEKALVLVIEKLDRMGSNLSVTYMVETLRIF